MLTYPGDALVYGLLSWFGGCAFTLLVLRVLEVLYVQEQARILLRALAERR